MSSDWKHVFKFFQVGSLKKTNELERTSFMPLIKNLFSIGVLRDIQYEF